MKYAALWLAPASLAFLITAPIAAAQSDERGQADERETAHAALFAPTDPSSVGIDAQRLEELGLVVQGYVDAKRIVGAELAVIKKDATVYHRGFGMKHLEEKVPMEPGTIFCVRSMTKPVVGAAVQILIDEKKLSLGDRVSKYLPAFDNDRSRKITIEELLTHTGGLPLSGLLARDITQVKGVRDIADTAGEKGPQFPPGERFHYSDDGADTLGALVEVASGKDLATLLEERIFKPLEMRDTIAVATLDHPLRGRVASAYTGADGAWSRFFGPQSPPIFNSLLASQGLYCSVLDYARFLHLWKRNGFDRGVRMLSTRAVRRALEPARAMSYPTSFEGMETYYGHMMQLWVDPRAGKKDRVFAFGHGGSDGTHAWVFPELDLMVFYFTQTRGNTTGIEIEQEIQRLLVDPLLGEKRAPLVTYTPTELVEFVGLYSEGDGGYCAVVSRNNGLALELPGTAIVDLVPTRKRDSFDLKLASGVGLDFERSEIGSIEAAVRHGQGQRVRMERLVPNGDLPNVDELMEHRKKAVDWTKIDEAGTIRWRSRISLPTPKLEGAVITHARGLTQFKSEVDFGSRQGSATLDKDRAWSWSSLGKLEELQGDRVQAVRSDIPLLVIADWRKVYADVRVVARSKWNDADAWVVRAIQEQGVAHTWYVSTESGLALALLAIAPIPGVGELGIVTQYEDWRKVGPLRFPFHRFGEYSSPLVGSFDVRVDSIELGVDAPASLFTVDKEREAKQH